MKDELYDIKPGIIKYSLSIIYESRDLKSSYIFFKKKRKSKLYPANEFNIFVKYINISK